MDSIGFVGDIHRNTCNLEKAIFVLKERGIKKAIANGDIGENEKDIAQALEIMGKSGIEFIIQPGSHEKIKDYEYTINELQLKYSNLIDALSNRITKNQDYHFVFLPGSDFCYGGQYKLTENIEEGHYLQTEQGLQKLSGYSLLEALGTASEGISYLIDMNSIKKTIEEPEKTILICHVPPKFSNLNCIDMAHYGEIMQPFRLKDVSTYGKGGILPYLHAKILVNAGAPVLIKKENRGNVTLRKIADELGIKKGVFNHFHESSHRANDLQGNKMQMGQFNEEMFWMSGYMAYGHFGILHIDKQKIAYENLSVREKNE